MSRPVRLAASFREKVWGTTAIEPWYPPSGKKIGEVWFLSEGEPLPILVKFVFTSEKLSVQVHPDDAFAGEHENSRGKTEMWYVLRAAPGAAIACGLRERITPERLREASLSGEIERLLNWLPVGPGDVIFTPPGTIHAIGAGIALCEIQQQSDITYRLYDYGRPRPLHLEKAMAVADAGPHPGKSLPVALAPGASRLAACPYFVTDLLEASARLDYLPDPARMHLLVFIEGRGTLAGEPYRAGEAWRVPPAAAPFAIEPAAPTRFLRTGLPA